ncbi:MAG: putative dual-specificity RNA methyltransferase RlmN [Acidimicrobiia bacterium]|nr:MAG: putative dual-specificity RNA methyltransferase RlmN [Acidimicrobiia bacterium]
MTDRYGATREELAAILAGLGEPRYRATQVHDALWVRRRPLEEATDLPRRLRDELRARLPTALTAVAERHGDGGATVKWLWRAADGAQLETVLMRYPNRATVCVSSQAGCAMGCTFCATGQAGFERHLSAGEICEQVLRAQHASPQRVGNVVYMGMGEPLANVEPVLESLSRLHADAGISARQLTVSTVGVVPGMEQLVRFALPVTLAVSLHAPDDDLRSELVPLDRRYPLADVIAAARAYAARKGRRCTFEYACIDGLNDAPAQADALARLLRGLRGGAHVNLIPLNPTGAFAGRASPPDRIAAFAQRLRALGVQVSVRRNRGVDIDAACGQLRAREARRPAGPGQVRARTRPSATMGA